MWRGVISLISSQLKKCYINHWIILRLYLRLRNTKLFQVWKYSKNNTDIQKTMDLWQGPWNKQTFILSFHFVISDYFARKAGKCQASVAELANAMKRVTLSPHSKMQVAEVKYMVVVQIGIIYCSQNTMNSNLNVSKVLIYKFRLLGIHVLVSCDKVSHFVSNRIQNIWRCQGRSKVRSA